MSSSIFYFSNFIFIITEKKEDEPAKTGIMTRSRNPNYKPPPPKTSPFVNYSTSTAVRKAGNDAVLVINAKGEIKRIESKNWLYYRGINNLLGKNMTNTKTYLRNTLQSWLLRMYMYKKKGTFTILDNQFSLHAELLIVLYANIALISYTVLQY